MTSSGVAAFRDTTITTITTNHGENHMSIVVNVSAGTKRSSPVEQYGSINAQVSLSGEAATLADVGPVMRDLLAAAQAGCDQHLAEQVAALTGGAAQPAPPPASPRPAYPPQANSQPRPVSRSPSQSRPAPRRGMPPISDAQRRLLDRLLDGDPQRADEVCQRAGVATVGALNMKQASEAIDWLKTQVPA